MQKLEFPFESPQIHIFSIDISTMETFLIWQVWLILKEHNIWFRNHLIYWKSIAEKSLETLKSITEFYYYCSEDILKVLKAINLSVKENDDQLLLLLYGQQ